MNKAEFFEFYTAQKRLFEQFWQNGGSGTFILKCEEGTASLNVTMVQEPEVMTRKPRASAALAGQVIKYQEQKEAWMKVGRTADTHNDDDASEDYNTDESVYFENLKSSMYPKSPAAQKKTLFLTKAISKKSAMSPKPSSEQKTTKKSPFPKLPVGSKVHSYMKHRPLPKIPKNVKGPNNSKPKNAGVSSEGVHSKEVLFKTEENLPIIEAKITVEKNDIETDEVFECDHTVTLGNACKCHPQKMYMF